MQTGMPNSSYAPSGVYYGNSDPMSSQASRKRAYENEVAQFVDDVKRQKLGASAYTHEIASRFAHIQSLMPAVSLDHHSQAQLDYNSNVMSSSGLHSIGNTYQLPYPSNSGYAKKADVLGADQYLHQLSSSMYENPSAAAASGVAQPGSHYIPTTVSYRSPSIASPHSPYSTSSQHTPGPVTHSSPSNAYSPGHDGSTGGTPALTPPMSYASSLSPVSIASHSVNYPSLPPLSSSELMSGIPTSTLGGAFDMDQRRRYSVGILQKSAPAEKMEVDDEIELQIQRERSISSSSDGISKEMGKVEISAPSETKKENKVDSKKSPEEIFPKEQALAIIKKLREDFAYMLKEMDGGASDKESQDEKEDLDSPMADSPVDRSSEESVTVKQELDVVYPELKTLVV